MTNRTILIVDDSDFDRSLLSKALKKKADFRTLEASSGKQCLEILKQQKINLILMDIMMPGTIGTQILTKIREQFNAIELPIIMVTAKADATDVIECLQNGANDYIAKPVNFDVAVTRIGTHLKLAELSHQMSMMKESAALDALITTYNHEINTPLAVALGCSEKLLQSAKSPTIETLHSSLWRVADIVRMIRDITDKKEIEYGTYIGSSKRIKLG